jgi:hypothetical protein
MTQSRSRDRWSILEERNVCLLSCNCLREATGNGAFCTVILQTIPGTQACCPLSHDYKVTSTELDDRPVYEWTVVDLSPALILLPLPIKKKYS